MADEQPDLDKIFYLDPNLSLGEQPIEAIKQHVDPFAVLRRIPIAKREEPRVSQVAPVPDDGRPKGHNYDWCWLTTDYFCPHCGQQPVHVEAGEGDYYVGATHWCCSCKTTFHLP
jgi:hypothetical protein